MIMIRQATENDAQELLNIYTPYIIDTTITFEDMVPTVEDFKNRINNISEAFPYFVAVDDSNQIRGYAYAHEYKPRAAYAWTVETSIYVEREYDGHGVGTILYQHLENTLQRQGVVNLMACITEDNSNSVKFHEKCGYEKVGTFKKVGFKFNRWLDIVWMQKTLNPRSNKIKKVISYDKLS